MILVASRPSNVPVYIAARYMALSSTPRASSMSIIPFAMNRSISAVTIAPPAIPIPTALAAAVASVMAVLPDRAPFPDVRYQMSDVRCQMSDVRCQMSDVRCQMSDVRCQMSDVRCQMSDVRCQMSDVRCQIPGHRRPFCHLISDICHLERHQSA